MLYRAHLARVDFRCTTLVVIGIDCIGSCKSTAIQLRPRWPIQLCWIFRQISFYSQNYCIKNKHTLQEMVALVLQFADNKLAVFKRFSLSQPPWGVRCLFIWLRNFWIVDRSQYTYIYKHIHCSKIYKQANYGYYSIHYPLHIFTYILFFYCYQYYKRLCSCYFFILEEMKTRCLQSIEQ